MANPNIKPRWEKGESGNPFGRPRGSKNYKTLFQEAYIAIAKDLNIGKEPDTLMVELLKKGIIQALKGNYNFYKDIMDRFYGKPGNQIELSFQETKEKELMETERRIRQFFEGLEKE